MVPPIELRAIQVQIEVAVVSRQLHDLLQLHELFAKTAIGDQTLDRANPQTMFFAKLHQFRQTRHCAIGVQNFAKHSRRLQARHCCQIDSGFGVPGHRTTLPRVPHASVLGAQGKYMARLAKVLWRRFRVGDCQDGRGAIISADAGGHAARRVH